MSATARHDEAMALTDAADALRRAGDPRCVATFARAADLEREAAELAGTSEPSRAILYRSAAWLALAAGDPDGAALLALDGLDGDGPRADLLAVLRAAEQAMAAR